MSVNQPTVLVKRWNNSHRFRLGLGEVKENVLWQPHLVDSLHIKGVEVQYVTCGAQHTMALSHSGVSTASFDVLWSLLCY